jgi:hypothetical protein
MRSSLIEKILIFPTKLSPPSLDIFHDDDDTVRFKNVIEELLKNQVNEKEPYNDEKSIAFKSALIVNSKPLPKQSKRTQRYLNSLNSIVVG